MTDHDKEVVMKTVHQVQDSINLTVDVCDDALCRLWSFSITDHKLGSYFKESSARKMASRHIRILTRK